MKKYLLLFALLSQFVQASTSDSLRTEMADLIKKRGELFSQYSASLAKKSGIFGNKTKNDLRDSQDKLKEIVEADNKIMNILNRTVDYRNFEKLNLTYDASSFAQRISNLTALNESLMKQNAGYAEQLTADKHIISRLRLYNILMITALLVTILYLAAKKFFRL
jgi:hypothetical protein